jgi:hypothetical protein
VSVEEEEPSGVSEEEDEPPPISPLSRLIKPSPSAREEERCGNDWSFPPPTYAREEERCDDG